MSNSSRFVYVRRLPEAFYTVSELNPFDFFNFAMESVLLKAGNRRNENMSVLLLKYANDINILGQIKWDVTGLFSAVYN